MSAPTFPASEERLVRGQRELDDLYLHLEELDREILLAVRRRSQVSRLIRARVGHPAVVSPERYGELGSDGRVLGRLLARLAHPHG
ncbi:chorismate mutase [Aldersonia sp. NBC_00410]|uniref:chorismate mutase n=1 Tax=Aldersonia sp. NBC_00410 TaxID=2975954 RepID=UPI002259B0FB|nr:chorismate mutase [Aldersonia sp. NBC_00410]MCX5043372.1 chorismate mutase [Aldersonia sp. NBC_00410]